MTKPIVTSLIIAGLILAGAAALKWAENSGTLTAEQTRMWTQIAIGLGLAVYANLIPKQISRKITSPEAAARSQAALRFGGWTLTLAGLVFAALWAFTPTAFADTASFIVLAAATLATAAYCIWSYASCRSTADTAH